MKTLLTAFSVGLIACFTASSLHSQEKPNIIVIWGDDIGYWNLSPYKLGMMGYETPNLERLAKESAIFTD
ncbi:MAG: hypothetical protein HRU46_11060 [Verrucomicrobiales bacterium]|nr:hypothetical protein [Verrucomicrobiales bacterium]